MKTAVVIIVIAVLVLVAVAALVSARTKRRRAGLQERFGPEYDRAVDEQGGRRQGESRLAQVAASRDKAEIRNLDPQERAVYSQRWSDVQGAFVDDPVRATGEADDLVGAVMRDRGYPLDKVGDPADLVAADQHPELAAHYRAAHEIGQRSQDATTEELRQAFVHYRALFVDLLADPDPADGSVDVTPGRHEVGRHEQLNRTDPTHVDRPASPTT